MRAAKSIQREADRILALLRDGKPSDLERLRKALRHRHRKPKRGIKWAIANAVQMATPISPFMD